MKIFKAIITAGLILTASNAIAEDTITHERFETCKGLEALSRTIMSSRQTGVSLEKMTTAIKNSSISETTKQCVFDLVIEAYEKPKFDFEENQETVINEFANKTFLKCIQSK
jgi:methylthioribose-1-phosphate isomerase